MTSTKKPKRHAVNVRLDPEERKELDAIKKRMRYRTDSEAMRKSMQYRYDNLPTIDEMTEFLGVGP